jgi:uncharacterized protein
VVLILRARERFAVPWKNGGGVTREVAVHPPGSALGEFGWRVSIAEAHAGGPFSSFPGVERQLAVLAGNLRLSIQGRPTLSLSPDSPPVGFPGDVPADAEPLGRPVTDLNVMTRRGEFAARLSRTARCEAAQLALSADSTLLIALSPLTLRAAGARLFLSALDAARLEDVARCEVAAVPGAVPGTDTDVPGARQAASFYLAEICAASGPGRARL